MSDGPPVDVSWEYVEGYDQAYAVTEAGEVWSCKSGRWERKKAWIEHGHETVELYAHGQRRRRRVSVLVDEAFGEDSKAGDSELREYLEWQYDVGDGVLEEMFDA